MAFPFDIKEMWNKAFRQSNTLTKIAVEIENTNPITVDTSPELPVGYSSVSYFGQALSVANGVLTVVLSKTISTTSLDLKKIEVSGESKSEFSVFINSNLVAKKRTYYTYLNESFDFDSLKLVTGDVLEIKTIHNRPLSANFEARIIGTEKA